MPQKEVPRASDSYLCEIRQADYSRHHGKRDVPAAPARFGRISDRNGIRVEVFGDLSLPGPVGMDHVHLYPYPTEADIPAIQAWYAKVFGGLPGKRQRVAWPGLTDCVYFHRFNLSFSPGEGKLAPTKGRALDHLGFDVRNLEEFEKRLGGTRPEVRSTRAPGSEFPDEGRVSDGSMGKLYRGHRETGALSRLDGSGYSDDRDNF